MTTLYEPYLDAAQSINGYQDTSQNGPAYYLSTLTSPEGASYLRSSESGALGAYYLSLSSDGKPYPGGRLCLTSTCLSATVSALNKLPIFSLPSSVLGLSGSNIFSSLPPLLTSLAISREALFLSLW